MKKHKIISAVLGGMLCLLFLSSCLGFPVSLNFTNSGTASGVGPIIYSYQAPGQEQSDLYAMNVDGSGKQYISAGGTQKWMGCNSYNLARMAYVDFDPDLEYHPSRLMVSDQDGNNPLELAATTEEDEPVSAQISGDSTRVAYDYMNSDLWRNGVRVIAADGSDAHDIFIPTEEEEASTPSLNSNGTLVAYTITNYDWTPFDSRQYSNGIYISNWAGDETQLVVADDDWDRWNSYPVFSPDDTHLAYIYFDQSGEEGICEIRILDLENPEAQPVTIYQMESPNYDIIISSLRYSPDGSRMLFTVANAGAFGPLDRSKKPKTHRSLRSSGPAPLETGCQIFSIDIRGEGQPVQLTNDEYPSFLDNFIIWWWWWSD